MNILTKDFHDLFEWYHLMSQKNNKNPLALAKIYINNKVFYLIEFWRESKSAFGYSIEWNTFKWNFLHLWNLEKDENIKIDQRFIPINLLELLKSEI